MNTQHHTPRARNVSGDDSSPITPRTPAIAEQPATSDQRVFDLPQSLVTSMSMFDLANRYPEDMPPASKYEAFHRIRVAKALTGSRDARQQLLAVRLLAITNLAYIHNESNFIEKVLRQDVDETRRFQLVYQLAELIHPSGDGSVDVPLWVQTIALGLLEAVSGFHARCQDVLSALNANVNHGILLYVIRKAVAGMREDDAANNDQVSEADEWRNNLFSLTLHLSMATRVGTEMVTAGLMDILVEMLKIRSSIAQRHHSMVLTFLDGLIWTYQNAFTAFFNAEGLDVIATLVVDTVKEAQQLRESGLATEPEHQSHAVDYEIPYNQQQTLKWLLKFVHHIMGNSYSFSGNTDRLLRNLAEKSDLLRSLREMIEHKAAFGSVVWTNSVTILSDFINNDPTSFAAISESGMIRSFLETITGRPLPEEAIGEAKQNAREGEDPDSPDSSVLSSFIDQDVRSHPPSEETLREQQAEAVAMGILPSADAINIVPQVLNSISLNNTGMKLVVASRAFDSFLEVFTSPSHVRCLEMDNELASTVGGSFDELARHHPSLRTSISNAVIDMVARVRYFGIEKARSAGWGAKLFVTGPNGNVIAVTEDASFRDIDGSSGKGKQRPSTGDSDVDMLDAAPTDSDGGKPGETDKTNTATESMTPYVFAVSSFLSQYLANSILKTNFVEKGGIELLLDICESPCLPATFGDTPAHRALGSVVTQLIEHAPARGLPSLLHRAQSAIDTLKPLISNKDAVPPYFAPFLTSDLGASQTNPEISENISNGTKIVKALLNAQTFLKIVSECFASTRSTLQFYRVNVYDYYLALIKSIGPMLRGVLAEEAGQITVVPQHWSSRRQASESEGAPRAARDVATDETLIPDVLNAPDGWKPSSEEGDSAPSRPTEQELTSPRFQNYETLRLLLHPMIPSTFPLLQSLGKALLPRRENQHGDQYPRPRHLELAKALADTVLRDLAPSVATPEPTTKQFHYWIIMLHTIHEMLIDHRKYTAFPGSL